MLSYKDFDEKAEIDLSYWRSTDDSKIFIYEGGKDSNFHKLKVNSNTLIINSKIMSHLSNLVIQLFIQYS